MEERNELLKQAGFSDQFLEAIQQFEKNVPIINIGQQSLRQDEIITRSMEVSDLIISKSCEQSFTNILIRQF